MSDHDPSDYCRCGAMTLATTLSERHDRGLHGRDRCTGSASLWASLEPTYATEARVRLLADRQHELWATQQSINVHQKTVNERAAEARRETTRTMWIISTAVLVNAVCDVVRAAIR